MALNRGEVVCLSELSAGPSGYCSGLQDIA